MRPLNRIITNTLAQYIRTIINLVLTLYSSRLILDSLGVEDYGIYALVAGVIGMLSFFTNSLVSSTQRFLSVSQGKKNITELNKIFNNCLILHILIGVGIVIILSSMGPLLFKSVLNIPFARIEAAKVLYLQVIGMVYISFVSSPFRALLVSRENIVYISIIDVLDGVFKVVLVFLLYIIAYDKLVIYGWILIVIQLFNLLAFSIFCYLKYEECSKPNLKEFDFSFLKKIISFTGWIVYSTCAIAVRNQGFGVVLNRVYGTAMNAAYGIGGQIAGMIAFLSASFSNAIAPQLMSAEGGGERERMWRLAAIQSKFSFLLLSILAIPTIFELNTLLKIWLVNVPEYSYLWGCMFILMQTIDQLSSGLGLANKAMGKIGLYTFVTTTPKLLIIPLSLWAFMHEVQLIAICLLFVSIETICMYLRIHLLIGKKGFVASDYCKNVILRPLIPVLCSGVVCYLICEYTHFAYRFIFTYISSIMVFIVCAYFCTLDDNEQKTINGILMKLKLNRKN